MVREREKGGGHNTKAMVADCSDNGLSSSEGLRGRRGVQAFRVLPPNTSLVGWRVGGLRACLLLKLGGKGEARGAPFHQWHMDLDREQEQSGAPYG